MFGASHPAGRVFFGVFFFGEFGATASERLFCSKQCNYFTDHSLQSNSASPLGHQGARDIMFRVDAHDQVRRAVNERHGVDEF